VKVLLLDERYPPELLEGFEIVREPQDDVVAALTVLQPVGEELFAQLPALRVVGTASVGFDRIDVDAAERRGIAVVNVPDYCTQEVADHTLALLYGLVRGIVVLDRDVSGGRWDAKAAGSLRTLAQLRSRTTSCRSSATASVSSSSTNCSPNATRSRCTCP
jgi:lactate dehydrogenase-like 2-hydroxyacid dehydrogenase